MRLLASRLSDCVDWFASATATLGLRGLAAWLEDRRTRLDILAIIAD